MTGDLVPVVRFMLMGAILSEMVSEAPTEVNVGDPDHSGPTGAYLSLGN